MLRLSRWILGAVLAVATVAPTRAAEVDNLLPSETESIIFFNVRQILDSDLMKKYAIGQVKQALEGNDAQKMLKQIGLDPLKDIERVTVGSWGKDKDDMNAVIIVRGKFEPEKLFNAAKDYAKNNGDKMSIVEEGDYKLIKFTPENQPKPFYASVADEKTIVGGSDKKLVTAALTAAMKGTKPTIKKDLAALMLKQDEKASMFACGLVEGKINELPPNVNIPGVDSAKLSKQLEKMKDFSMTLRLSTDVNLELTAGMKDADAADDFGGTVNQLIDTVKNFLPLLAGNKPEMKPLIDELTKTLKSKVKDSEVTLTVKLSADAIGKAAGGAE